MTMLNKPAVEIANGVTRHDCFWGYFLEGRKDDLLAAGLAKPDWFPDGLERDKWGKIIRQRRITLDGKEVRCRAWPYSKGAYKGKTKFHVDFIYSQEERQRVEEMAQYEKAALEQRKELDAMPSSHEEFRDRAQQAFNANLESFLEWHASPTKYNGYSYSPEVIEELDLKGQEFLAILATGKTLFSQERHQVRIKEINATLASADPALRDFLDKVTNGGSRSEMTAGKKRE